MQSADLVVIATGSDGTEFHIHGNLPRGVRAPRRGSEGVVLQRLKGVAGPPTTLRRRSAARQDGSTPGSTKVDERIVEMDVVITSTRAFSLDEVWAHWRRIWDDEVRLVCHTRRGVRWLNLRLASEMEMASDIDPHKRGCIELSMTCVATDPYAYSAPWTYDMRLVGGVGAVTIENPTDTPVWPRFVCNTPGTGWTFFDGVDGGEVPLDKITVAGFGVDTDPLKTTVTAVDGTPQWGKTLGRAFTTPIPPHTPPITVGVKGPTDGSPTVRVILDRRWQTPW
ncbi:hypothetical protein [Corynebacterium variabile]|uniref:hypothetical protein n=1 Tax=Corynebacterium variabile TaxID=1727 RepID=UPI003FD08195